jgi:uncharacterized protein with NRDE domain
MDLSKISGSYLCVVGCIYVAGNGYKGGVYSNGFKQTAVEDYLRSNSAGRQKDQEKQPRKDQPAVLRLSQSFSETDWNKPSKVCR